ncbi:MaoC/PaaZ C-terminal domain-containing protein [Streptomyces sp. NPDC046831]|uniref:MaoC family dehydratase n=1 Tax=Streptomyces sp. NPDC046831 TaxID=3154805 RepID=UPI00340F0C7A
MTVPNDSTTVVLTRSPALAPLLARGALRSPFKRPRPDAPFPRTRLVLPAARVDLARLAAYERVCGFASGEETLPVTFPHVLGFPPAMRLMSGGDFPLPLLGLVHTSIDITRHRPLPATGAYELAVRVVGLTPHRRGTEATVVTELRDGGDVVWESSSTYLARHRTDAPAHGPGRTGRERDEQRAGGERGEDAESEARRQNGERGQSEAGQENAERGQSEARRENGEHGRSEAGQESAERRGGGEPPLPAVAEWRLAGDVGRRYGAASGDRNPIHLSPLTARLFGFPRAIAHGMWTVARCLAAHGTPPAARVRAEFRAPVLLPGTVTYAADATGRFALRDGGGERVHLTGEVRPLRG